MYVPKSRTELLLAGLLLFLHTTMTMMMATIATRKPAMAPPMIPSIGSVVSSSVAGAPSNWLVVV